MDSPLVTLNHPAIVGYHSATQEFHKMHEPKIKKLKAGYSSNAALIFQSCPKDKAINIEDCQLLQTEAIQLINHFSIQWARQEVKFHMSMAAEDN